MVGSGRYQHAQCNERLELLGDAVLGAIVSEFLFSQFPDADEGKLTKMKSRLVSRQTLGEIGKRAGLDALIELRLGEIDFREKIVGNALEALVAAVYLDAGYERAAKLVRQQMLDKYADWRGEVEHSTDFKSHFIEWAQRARKAFEFETSARASGDGQFESRLLVDQQEWARATGRSKKGAEQAAAALAMQRPEVKPKET